MSRSAAPRALAALAALGVEHRLGPLRTVRLDPAVAAQVRSLAGQLPPGPGPDGAALSSPADALSHLLDLAGRLLWSRQYPAVRALLEVVRRVGEAMTATGGRPGDTGAEGLPPWDQVSTGYLALADLGEHGPDRSGTTEDALARAAHSLWRAADGYLVRHDHRRAALVASAGLWLLFHQELHDARPTSPLVSEPGRWLHPLTASRTGRLLTGPGRPSPPRREAVRREAVQRELHGMPSSGTTRRRSVLVLSGSYPRFAGPVIESLRTDRELTVSELALSEVDKPFRRMAVEPWLVEVRLRAALGEPVRFAPLEGPLATADSVLADWADAGAMLTSLATPPGTALSVRVHSVDALRCWLHLIDWSAVDQLICVGPHVQDLIDAQLGDRVAHVRHLVLPNLLQLGRFDHPRSDDSAGADGSDRTLAMVGWGRAVKDPLWTVELLSRLRRHDPRWRLLLVGHPFPGVLAPTARDYARRFDERVQAADVRDAIEYVGFTPDLAPVLARVGWVVSSSVRESWGVGPMEAVAAGAVPVIRNWPLFARWGGPRRLYPDEWVVDSLDEAEEHILRITREGRREAVARASRDLLSDLFDPQQAAAGYHAALTEGG